MISANWDEFDAGLAADAKRVEDAGLAWNKRLVRRALRGVVLRTPVWENRPSDPPSAIHDGGATRGAWVLSIGAEETEDALASDVPDRIDPTGQITIAEEGAKIERLPFGAVAFLTNSRPNAIVLDLGLYPNPPKRGTGRTVGGYSTQAPAGMTALTAAEIEENIGGGL